LLYVLADTMLMLKLFPASEKHGPISHYYVIVIPFDESDGRLPDDFDIDEASHFCLMENASLFHIYIIDNDISLLLSYIFLLRRLLLFLTTADLNDFIAFAFVFVVFTILMSLLDELYFLLQRTC